MQERTRADPMNGFRTMLLLSMYQPWICGYKYKGLGLTSKMRRSLGPEIKPTKTQNVDEHDSVRDGIV